MKTKLIAAMAVLTGAAVASFQACSSTQPHSSCFVQGGDVGTPFFAKYTIVENHGCAFFGTHVDANGKNVSAEPIGVTLMGKTPNLVVAMLPLTLSGGAPAGDAGIPAVGNLNGNPTVCAAVTMSDATAIIVDPNSQNPATFPQALFFGDGGCGPEDGGAAVYDDGGAFDCNFEADGGPGATTTTTTTTTAASGSGSTGTTTAASGSGSTGTTTAASGSGSTGTTTAASTGSSTGTTTAASTGGSTGTTTAASTTGSGSTGGTTGTTTGGSTTGTTGGGLPMCSDCTADTDCDTGFCNTTSAPTGFCDSAAACTADADCTEGNVACDPTSGACQCPQVPPPTPYVQATYTFTNVKFVQAGNVAGTQFFADLTYKQVALTANATSCDATIRVDAVWYNNTSSSSAYPDGGTPTDIYGPAFPDGGATDLGEINNHCDVDADCASATQGGLFNLPGDGSAFQCLQLLPTNEAPETMWDGGQGLPFRCVPATAAPAGATDCYTNCGS